MCKLYTNIKWQLSEQHENIILLFSALVLETGIKFVCIFQHHVRVGSPTTHVSKIGSIRCRNRASVRRQIGKIEFTDYYLLAALIRQIIITKCQLVSD